jgi:hypothetical protein
MKNELARRDDGRDSKSEVPGTSNSKFQISNSKFLISPLSPVPRVSRSGCMATSPHPPQTGLLPIMPYRFNRSHQLLVRNRLCALFDSIILQDPHKEPAMNGTSGFEEVRSSTSRSPYLSVAARTTASIREGFLGHQVVMKNRLLPSSFDHIALCAGIRAIGKTVPATFSSFRVSLTLTNPTCQNYLVMLSVKNKLVLPARNLRCEK